MAYDPSNPAGSTSFAAHATTGVISAGTDIALKVFSGEVLTAFAKKNVFMPLVTTRTINSGKSAQFPVIGRIEDTGTAPNVNYATKVHIPGNDIAVSTVAQAEQVITVKARRYASVFVDDLEEAMSHYEVRGQYSTEIGNVLSNKVDSAVIAQLAACTTATNKTGQPSANAKNVLGLTNSTALKAAFPDKLVEAMFDTQTVFDNNDATGERTLVLNPEAYYLLVQSSKAVNRDWTSSNGGIDTGNVFKIAGVPVVVSTNLPSGTWGFMFTPQAVGVVKLIDIKSEANYIPEKLGTLLVSSYAMGEGVLNAGCSQQFTTT
jgi:hypothetical protein